MKLIKKIIKTIILIFTLLLIIYTAYTIINWSIENKKNNKIKQEVIKESNIQERKYKFPYIMTNLSRIIEMNNKTKGWLLIPKTNISYPVLQHTDNDYYLNHDFNEKYNSAGWVFLDYRNNTNELDTNIIIYAHNRLDGSMFGTLKDTQKKEWHLNNKYLYFNTIDTMNTYEIFSVYTIHPADFKTYLNFSSHEKYQEYLNFIKNKSIFDLNVEVTTNDKIITLYTCHNNNRERNIVHAKLIQTKTVEK